MQPRWYLIHCKPRQEKTARVQLERQGYLTFLPLIRTQRRKSGRILAPVEAMFPRYLFVRLEAERDNFSPIRSTVGVSEMVRFGDAFATIPNDFVTALQRRGDQAGIYEEEIPSPCPGDPVRIVDGPLTGYEATFSSPKGSERVAVLLRIAGRNVEVEINESALAPQND